MTSSPLSVHPPTSFPASWTLVLPSVTIGNTPQLCLDLILTTLPAVHVAHLRAPSVLPFVSATPAIPAHKSSLLTSLQLYQLSGTNIFVVQQRAPTARGRACEFAHAVVEWAVSNGCDELCMVCSSNAAGLRGLKAGDMGMNEDGALRWMRYVGSTSGLGLSFIRRAKSEGVRVMETMGGDARGWEGETMDNVGRDLGREEGRIPGFVTSARRGSFVRGVLEKCEEMGVAVGGLVQFVHEGDNRGDAGALAEVVGRLLGIVEARSGGWRVPRAWGDADELPNGLY